MVSVSKVNSLTVTTAKKVIPYPSTNCNIVYLRCTTSRVRSDINIYSNNDVPVFLSISNKNNPVAHLIMSFIPKQPFFWDISLVIFYRPSRHKCISPISLFLREIFGKIETRQLSKKSITHVFEWSADAAILVRADDFLSFGTIDKDIFNTHLGYGWVAKAFMSVAWINILDISLIFIQFWEGKRWSRWNLK